MTNDMIAQVDYLQRLLDDKKISEILCLTYRLGSTYAAFWSFCVHTCIFISLLIRSYWKPSVIGNHLEQAASFAKSRESTLSIADSVCWFFIVSWWFVHVQVDSICKIAFFNFIAYMIYRISKSHCLELLLSSHCDDATLDLFLRLLDIYPLPRLTEIKVRKWKVNCSVFLYILFLYYRHTTILGIAVCTLSLTTFLIFLFLKRCPLILIV